MEPSYFLAKLQHAKGTNAKKKVLAEGLEDPIITEILRWTLSPFITFGVAPPSEPLVKPCSVSDVGSSILFEVLKNLSTRQTSGDAARLAVDELLHDRALGWLAWHVLSKDLRAGVSAKTVNAVKPGTVPQFDVALASPGGYVVNNRLIWDAKIKGFSASGVLVEPKLDGVRCLIIVRDGSVETLSREGKPLNLPRIQQAMANAAHGVYDSEAMHPAGFKETTKRVRAKVARDAGVAANIFDYIPLNEFEAGKSTTTQLQRTIQIAEALSLIDADCVHRVLAQSVRVSDVPTLFAHYREAGYEGIIIKNPDAPYSFRRDQSWVKVKERLSVTGKIVGIEEGKGKHKGRMGALWVEGMVDHEGEEIPFRTKVGIFNDEEREDYWAMRDKLSKAPQIEIAYQEVTKGDKKDVHALRFPVFLGERRD